MRFRMLAALAFWGGCLHPQAPARPSTADREAFIRLVNDPVAIGAAAEYVKTRRLPRDAWAGPSMEAWKTYMKARVYEAAAEVAWRFGLDPKLVGYALQRARAEAAERVAAFVEHQGDERDGFYRTLAENALAREILIACRYGPARESAELAVRDAAAWHELTGGAGPALYALLDEGCPVDADLRLTIIEYAVEADRDAYAIRHAAHAGWDDAQRVGFVARYFFLDECRNGFLAFDALDPPAQEVASELQRTECEDDPIPSGVSLRPADASTLFFAAVRGESFLLAHALLGMSSLGDDGLVYLLQEMTRGGWEYKLKAFLEKRPELYDRAMAYALEAGHVRLVGHMAKTPEMLRRAFDRAIELGLAAEALFIAENGEDEALKKEAPLMAFRAAMRVRDLDAARFISKRYPDAVPEDELEAMKTAWYERRRQEVDRNEALKPKRKRKPKPRCGDWTVTSKDACE